MLSCKRANLSSVIWQNCYQANLLSGISVIWPICTLPTFVLEKLLYGEPGNLACLLYGEAVIGQACYNANMRICYPFSGKSVIWQIWYVAFLLSGKYVICQPACWKRCYMVNLDNLAYLLSGKAVIGQAYYLANGHLRGSYLAEGAAQQKGHVQHQWFFFKTTWGGVLPIEGCITAYGTRLAPRSLF